MALPHGFGPRSYWRTCEEHGRIGGKKEEVLECSREMEIEGNAQKEKKRGEEEGRQGGWEREQEGGGAARLTNRSIVGGKAIRSLTSLNLDPAPSFFTFFFFCFSLSLFLSLWVFPHVHLREPRARSLAERGKSALPLSNLSSVRKNWPAFRG